MIARTTYTSSNQADSITAGIMECYESLSPEGKAEVDALADDIIRALKNRREGNTYLGRLGAIELIGKLLIFEDTAKRTSANNP